MDLNKSADIVVESEVNLEEDNKLGSSGYHFIRKMDEQNRQPLEAVGTSQKREGGSSESETQKSDCSVTALFLRRIRVLEDQKAALEREVAMLRKQNMELEEKMASSQKEIGKDGFKENAVSESSRKSITVIDDESTVNELTSENDVLRSEKKVAETEAAKWEQKCGEFKSWLLLNPKHGLVSKTEHDVPGSGNVDVCREDTEIETTPVKPACDSVNVSNDSEALSLDARTDSHSRGRKKLSFVDTELSRKKVAPSTPAAKMPESSRIIDLVDSDEEQQDTTPLSRDQPLKVSDVSIPLEPLGAISGGDKMKASSMNVEDDNEEDMDSSIHFVATPTRKRALKLVASDSEAEDGDSDDDNVPISHMFRKNLQQQTDQNTCDYDSSKTILRRRRFMKLSALEERTEPQSKTETDVAMDVDSDDEVEREGGDMSENRKKSSCGQSIDDNTSSGARRSQRLLKMRRLKVINQPAEEYHHLSRTLPAASGSVPNDDSDHGTEDTDSDCLKGFIVDDDVIDDAVGAPENGASDPNSSGSEAEDVSFSSESETDLDEILDRLKRGKNHQTAPMEWEMLGDMLAAFGKDAELCMKAVCALCRRQTNDEQLHEGTFVTNGRGFSKFDAARGTKLAKFLTDGDLGRDVRKSVDELRRVQPNGPELCRTLPLRYSKQLFEIYRNGEDAYFRPPN